MEHYAAAGGKSWFTRVTFCTSSRKRRVLERDDGTRPLVRFYQFRDVQLHFRSRWAAKFVDPVTTPSIGHIFVP